MSCYYFCCVIIEKRKKKVKTGIVFFSLSQTEWIFLNSWTQWYSRVMRFFSFSFFLFFYFIWKFSKKNGKKILKYQTKDTDNKMDMLVSKPDIWNFTNSKWGNTGSLRMDNLVNSFSSLVRELFWWEEKFQQH